MLEIADLISKDALFDVCVTEPRVLSLVAHLLGPRFQLSSLDARHSGPGVGHQPLHTDWLHGVGAREYYACNTPWYLDDGNADNGATRVVPGSHR